MTTRLLAALGIALFAVGSTTPAQSPKEKSPATRLAHMVVLPDDVKWMEAPGFPPGTKIAILDGDPSKAGSMFTLRLKAPAGSKIPPHWHSGDEMLTVIEGSFGLGFGEKFDKEKIRYMPAGTYARMSKGDRHFALTKGETIVQVSGVGPFDINYVDAADDPAKKGEK
jgi:quercetin dioxygenase-like cupin family protein